MVEKTCHLLQMIKKFNEKYDEIWNVVKSLLKLKFAASPIRDDKYLINLNLMDKFKDTLKAFNDFINMQHKCMK